MVNAYMHVCVHSRRALNCIECASKKALPLGAIYSSKSFHYFYAAHVWPHQLPAAHTHILKCICVFMCGMPQVLTSRLQMKSQRGSARQVTASC